MACQNVRERGTGVRPRKRDTEYMIKNEKQNRFVLFSFVLPFLIEPNFSISNLYILSWSIFKIHQLICCVLCCSNLCNQHYLNDQNTLVNIVHHLAGTVCSSAPYFFLCKPCLIKNRTNKDRESNDTYIY